MMNTLYRLIEERELKEYHSTSYYYEHIKSGARIFILENDDDENLFCLGFRTPPDNDTGVAHILEHTVLCGSKNYPIKDPFLSLLKGSMQTFLNAMTYPDKTLYPAASIVEKDFFNLLGVYADAVFFPLLKKEAFHQEGFRYEFNEAGELTENGVVLNEMKGNYSSMENFVYDTLIQSLFPTTTYQYDSGGNPDFIPLLTYEQFVSFHKTHYHPANCSIFLYGNINKEKKLRFLDENYLSQFSKEEVSSAIGREEPFEERRRIIKYFGAEANNDDEKLATVSVNWRLCDVADKDEILALEALSHILLGASGAPFFMSLQNSRLGQDVSPVSGLGLDYKEAVFAAALRGVAAENEEKVEPLVFNALEQIINEGITHEEIEAALRVIEFGRRSVRSGPYGLQLMGRLYRYWNYGVDPNRALLFEDDMRVLRHKAFKAGYFESLIKKYLIDNKNCTVVTVRPDAQTLREAHEKKAAALKQKQERLTDEERQIIQNDKKALEAYQSSIDTEGVAPRLTREDIPVSVRPTLYREEQLEERPLIVTERFTRSLYYWRLAFECSDLTFEELRWLPFFTHALSEMGWDGISYDKVSREIALNTADFSVTLESSVTWASGGLGPHRNFMIVSFSALESQLGAMSETISNILTRVNFNDGERLKDLFYEIYNTLKKAVVPSGSSFVGLRLASKKSVSYAVEEEWHGIKQLLFLDKMKKDIENPDLWEQVAQVFTALRDKLLVRERLYSSITVDSEFIGRARDVTDKIIKNLPLGIKPTKTAAVQLTPSGNEGFIVQSKVNYAGMLFESSPYLTKERSAEVLLAQFLTSGILWEKIRMRGGAYGISASLGSLENFVNIISYRDPRLKETFDDYESIINTFKGLTDEELLNALISVVGREMRPQAPKDDAFIAFKRYLYGISDEARQQIRNYTLELSRNDIEKAAKRWRSALKNKTLVAIGNNAALKETKEIQHLFELPQ
jgi:Zn-dependent M16 (insulinase) family peptidase